MGFGKYVYRCNKKYDLSTSNVMVVKYMVFLQDRATFHRLIVRNNAKKRKMYEAFIECVPLLKSLEVSGLKKKNHIYKFSAYSVCQLCLLFVACLFSSLKLSERMKIVDVLGIRVFKDWECIIKEVHMAFQEKKNCAFLTVWLNIPAYRVTKLTVFTLSNQER